MPELPVASRSRGSTFAPSSLSSHADKIQHGRSRSVLANTDGLLRLDEAMGDVLGTITEPTPAAPLLAHHSYSPPESRTESPTPGRAPSLYDLSHATPESQRARNAQRGSAQMFMPAA